MPTPKPGEKETKEEFIARFMGDEEMVKEYPDQKQRSGVAYSQWERKNNEVMSIDIAQFLKGIDVEKEHAKTVDNDPKKIAEIVLDHLREDQQYYDKLEQVEQKQNAKEFGQPFDSKFLEIGLCNYADVKEGMAFLGKVAIDKCIHTFIGRPVLIGHDNDLTPENMEDKAQGYIHEVYFDPSDGWYHCRGLIVKDEGKEKINNDKWKVSCAYGVSLKDNSGGVWHNCKYDYEILEFVGNHLALVENPRYEDATIKLNSKKGDEKMFFNKKNEEPEEKEKEKEEKRLNDEEKKNEDKKANDAADKKNDDEEKKNNDADEEIEVDGDKVKMSDLKKCWKTMKKNEEKKKNNEEKKNDDEEEEDKELKEKTIKENSKSESYFQKLNKLADNAPLSFQAQDNPLSPKAELEYAHSLFK